MKCPYNPEHVMPDERLLWHLTKCPDAKTYGHLFATCKFNAMHIVKKEEILVHERKCEKNQAVKDYGKTRKEEEKTRVDVAPGWDTPLPTSADKVMPVQFGNVWSSSLNDKAPVTKKTNQQHSFTAKQRCQQQQCKCRSDCSKKEEQKHH